jgi:two-component system response regulator RegA
VRVADGFELATALAHTESPEVALVDLRMPGCSGLELVRELHAIDRATRIIVLTGYGSIAPARHPPPLSPAQAAEISARRVRL